MESKKQLSTGIVVLITTLVIALIGTICFIVYDKVIKKDEVKEPTTNEENNEIKDPVTNEENKPSNEVVTGKIIVEEKNNMLYVNNNKVDFYSVSDAAKEYDYTSEDDFYNRDFGAGYIYYIIGDVVFVRFSAAGDAFSAELYFVDNNGKIIKKINGENADMILSRNTGIIDSVEVRRNFLSVYFIIKNSDVAMGSECAICDRFAKGEENEIAVYVDRIAYLGNGEFKLYKAVETMTYEQYAETRRGFNIDYCYTCVS